MIHLTHTGYNAGQTFCLVPRETDGQYAHGSHAPLHRAEYRAQCCADCLTVWANYAYDEDDEMPDWVQAARTV